MRNFWIRMLTRWFSWFFRIINIHQCLNILFDGVDREPRQEKQTIFCYMQFKWCNCQKLLRWLKLITCSCTCREYTVKKNITTGKKDNQLSHENSIKDPHFYCKQKSRFILRHLTHKKNLKRFITECIPDVRATLS